MRITGKSLRALLMAGAVLLAGFSQARAAEVTLNFDGVTPGMSVNTGGSLGVGNTNTGKFTWNVVSTNAPGVINANVLNNPFSTFCIELGENIGSNQTATYTITTDLAGLPQTSYGAGMGAAKAQHLQNLADMIGKGLAGILAFPDQNMAFAAIQAAIWEIVFDNDFDVSTGSFQVLGNAALINHINSTILPAVQNYTVTEADREFYFLGLSNAQGVQDQLFLVPAETFITFVPVPAGAVMAGVGVACIGAFSVIRRRKAQVAA